MVALAVVAPLDERGAHRLMKVVSRYVLVEFLRIFGLCMVGFLLIYVLVDLLDRLQGFLKFHASVGEVCRYLFFKIPLIVTQLVPIATLASVLIALGTMARHNELTALRASGMPVCVAAR